MTKVYLVGAGPGDADLLTLKAMKLLQSADAIVYDALVSTSILSALPRGAERIYVGKRAGKHAMKQEEINQLLIETAQRVGGTIVRLKGGDPFIFGRGGEEMQALARVGIDYEVVPGITAGVAAPAYFGIPATHRGISRSVSLITASTREGGIPDLDWSSLAKISGTLVFYMSMRATPIICRQLICHGLPSDMPAAIISRGTLPTQTLHKATAGEYAESTQDFEAFAPGLLMIGEVVGFADQYAWRRPMPLAGQRILVTRSEAQASRLVEVLEARGAEAILLPTIEITQGADRTRVETSPRPSTGDCLMFTSTNGVHHYMQALHRRGCDSRFVGNALLVAIGPATAKALNEYGLQADYMPDGAYTAQGLLQGFLNSPLYSQTKRVFLPTSPLASGELRDGLRQNGLEVEEWHLYDNRPMQYTQSELRQILESGLDWITFCSSSAVHNFVSLLRLHDCEHFLSHIPLSAIGEVTARTIEAYGFVVSAMPSTATLDALADSLAQSER